MGLSRNIANLNRRIALGWRNLTAIDPYSKKFYENRAKRNMDKKIKYDGKYGDIDDLIKKKRSLNKNDSDYNLKLQKINNDLEAAYGTVGGEKKYKKAHKKNKKRVKRLDKDRDLIDSGKWLDKANARYERDRARKKLEKLEAKKNKLYDKYGITTTEALTSMFKREKDLTGLRGKSRRDAKRYNKRLQLLQQKNDDTFGRVKEHIGNNIGAYGLGAAALLGGGALLANNAHKRNMIKMAYNNQMARRNANYKLIGDIAGSVISGMRGGQQPYLGGAGVYGYNPYQQQQQPKKRSLVGSVARAAASNPALAQVALGAASKFMK